MDEIVNFITGGSNVLTVAVCIRLAVFLGILEMVKMICISFVHTARGRT